MPKEPHPNQIKALEENRAKTQFGGERGNTRRQDNPNANKPWSVRNAVRYLGAQRIDPSDPKAIQKALGNNPTCAQLAAASCVTRAIKGEQRAFESMVEQIDGKLIQTNINADLEDVRQISDHDREILDSYVRSKLNDVQGD